MRASQSAAKRGPPSTPPSRAAARPPLSGCAACADVPARDPHRPHEAIRQIFPSSGTNSLNCSFSPKRHCVPLGEQIRVVAAARLDFAQRDGQRLYRRRGIDPRRSNSVLYGDFIRTSSPDRYRHRRACLRPRSGPRGDYCSTGDLMGGRRQSCFIRRLHSHQFS